MGPMRLFAAGVWRRFYSLLEAGFEVMARYPYDMTDMRWDTDLFRTPDDHEEPGAEGPVRPYRGPPGRSIKVVPTPASQRYQAARPRRVPAHHSRHKQSV